MQSRRGLAYKAVSFSSGCAPKRKETAMDRRCGCLLLVLAACGPAPAHSQLDPYWASEQALTVCPGANAVLGVDVYHADNAGQTIDWATVKAANRLFGYAKASEGTSFTDPMFATNWQSLAA